MIDALVEWGYAEEDELVYTFGLVATELITNAVIHAGMLTPSISMLLSVSGGTLRLGIRDNHTTQPQRRAASMEATCGRGTTIVDILLGELGGRLRSEHHRVGKTVWAELPIGLG
ncbi:ATP-binding protein [Streptomyces sp. NBC_00829]|uniref:ATP-binding protein n=1 Tax=Streptomyces sp. NBC_00829 TaxID=2903679 RepID=UPI0038632335|nr:ATP-binding protein [Streptomyces sp. NBC_00829]